MCQLATSSQKRLPRRPSGHGGSGSGRFQVVVADEALDGVHTDSGRDERFFYKLCVDLRGVDPGKFLFQPVDFLDGFPGKRPA